MLLRHIPIFWGGHHVDSCYTEARFHTSSYTQGPHLLKPDFVDSGLGLGISGTSYRQHVACGHAHSVHEEIPKGGFEAEGSEGT